MRLTKKEKLIILDALIYAQDSKQASESLKRKFNAMYQLYGKEWI